MSRRTARLAALALPLALAPAAGGAAAVAAEPPALRATPPASVCALRLPVVTFTVVSRVLGETRRVNVYTPPGYAADPAARYPVLYLPDGGLAEDFPHVAEAVHSGIGWGILRPLIVVGIENTERRRDLTGETAVAKDREIAPRVGGAAAFRRFLREELMPHVAARWRVGEESAVMGESLAGLFVLETFFLEPDLFDAWVAIDPSLWWNDHRLVREAGARLRARPAAPQTLYLTTSEVAEIAEDTAAIARAIAEAAPPGLAWHHHPMPGEFHDTIYRAAAPRALRVLFAAAPGAAN
jgi:predicted alpha/beta superfamily hydrolase